MSELAVKPRRTVRAQGADHPQLRDLTHQRQTCSLVQIRISLRTVRSPRADHPQFTFQPKPEKQPLWYKSKISRRTVRAPKVDCPPFSFEAPPERHPFWYNFEIKWRTVRPPGPDCPPAHQSLCKLSGTGADCPSLLSQHSNLVYFKSFQNAISPHACN